MSRGEKEKKNNAHQVEYRRGDEWSASEAARADSGLETSANHPAPRENDDGLPRKLPASIIYWTLGMAVVALMLGLTTRPRNSLGADQPGNGMRKTAVQVVSLSTSASAAEDPTGGFHFFIMLGPRMREWDRETWADHLESRLKAKLARHGFPNIGVSVGRGGAVFLAGTLFAHSEKWVVEKIVEHTPGVESVHFPHPEIRKLYGPAYLGIETAPSGRRAGVKVMKVWPGSPAATAGLRAGDVIVTFGGRRVRGSQTFRYLVASHVGGQRIPVTVERRHLEKQMTVRLGQTSALLLD